MFYAAPVGENYYLLLLLFASGRMNYRCSPNVCPYFNACVSHGGISRSSTMKIVLAVLASRRRRRKRPKTNRRVFRVKRFIFLDSSLNANCMVLSKGLYIAQVLFPPYRKANGQRVKNIFFASVRRLSFTNRSTRSRQTSTNGSLLLANLRPQTSMRTTQI